MQQGPPRRRRARPVADAPIDELLSRTDELAKNWLLALLERLALEDAPTILATGIAADGPRICGAVLRAIVDDHDLRRLQPGGGLEPLVSECGGFAGRDGPGAALVVVETLHEMLWRALRNELRDPEPDLIYELAERLAAVVELVRAAAVRRQSGHAPSPQVAAPAPPVGPADVPPGPSSVPPAPAEVSAARAAASPAGAEVSAARAEVSPAPAEVPHDQPAPAPEREPALWIAALEEEIARSKRSGAALSLLLVELPDSDRLLAAARPAELTAAFGRFSQAVRSVLRRQDLLASEADTRVWVIARDTARAGASALGQRIADAVRTADALSGAPLTVSVGLAVLGEDGTDGASLLAAAEEAAFAAAASGAAVGGRR